jgi:hypothetical protein
MCSALERRHAPTGNKGRSPSQRAALFMFMSSLFKLLISKTDT